MPIETPIFESRRRLLVGLTFAPLLLAEGGCQRYAEVVDFSQLRLSVPRRYFETVFNQSADSDNLSLGAIFPAMDPAPGHAWNSNSLIYVSLLRLLRSGTRADDQASRLDRIARMSGESKSRIPIVRPGDPLNFDLRSANVTERCVVFKLQDGTAWSRCDSYEQAANFRYDRQFAEFEVRYELRKKSSVSAWEADAAVIELVGRLRALYALRHSSGER